MKIGCIPDPESEMPNTEQQHVKRDPNFAVLSNFPILSENIVNTERVSTVDRLADHLEGGWPKEVDISDKNEMRKLVKKKLEKTPENVDKFTPAVKKMVEQVEQIIARNEQIDMFEQYFANEPSE